MQIAQLAFGILIAAQVTGIAGQWVGNAVLGSYAAASAAA